MTNVDHGWQERAPRPHLPDQEPPPDHEDFKALRVMGLRSMKKALRNRLTALGRARRWARAWKGIAKHLDLKMTVAQQRWEEIYQQKADRIAELERTDSASIDECARCGAAVCRGAKLRVICEDCLPLPPVKYWKEGVPDSESPGQGGRDESRDKGSLALEPTEEMLKAGLNAEIEPGVKASEDIGVGVMRIVVCAVLAAAQPEKKEG